MNRCVGTMVILTADRMQMFVLKRCAYVRVEQCENEGAIAFETFWPTSDGDLAPGYYDYY